jgi:TPR repeat protein
LERKNPNCQYALAKCFEEARGVLKNWEEALSYYKLSAEGGCALAHFRLGKAYFYGDLGLSPSYPLAKYHFEAAAQKDHSSALRFLGDMYENGLGVEKSLPRAFAYYERAASCGNSYAYYDAGWALLDMGKLSSYPKAVEYFRIAAGETSIKISDPKLISLSQEILGYCFEEGKGIPKDLKEAFRYYNLVAENNISEGWHNLFRCFLYGIGVELSASEAFRVCKRAADAGVPQAQKKLGECYQKGFGVEQSVELAEYYYRLAEEGINGEA